VSQGLGFWWRLARVRQGRVPGTPNGMQIALHTAHGSVSLIRGPHCVPRPDQIGIEPRTPTLLTAQDGPLWRAVRSAVAPAFSATSLKQVIREGGG
jgi:cytochrome P450